MLTWILAAVCAALFVLVVRRDARAEAREAELAALRRERAAWEADRRAVAATVANLLNCACAEGVTK